MATKRAPHEVLEAALPNSAERVVVLRQLLRSAERAAQLAPSAWAVSLSDAGFRLSVGQVETLALFGDTLRVLLSADDHDPRLNTLPISPTAYRSVRGPQSAFVGTVAEYVAAQQILEPLHIAFVDMAATTSTGQSRKGTPHARHHSPALMAYAATASSARVSQPQTTPDYSFKVGETYTRRDIFQTIGLPDHHGGPWFTGYASHGPDWFIFCGIGTKGRTGHDYDNHFEGDHLVWYGKGPSNLRQPSIQDLLSPVGRVYLFYRENDRDPFAFAGLAAPVQTFDTTPVKVIWRFDSPDGLRPDTLLPEEVDEDDGLVLEGARRSVVVNIYERDPNARRRCLNHWKPKCQVCRFDFGAIYGALGEGFIHVHHLQPLGELREEYQLDPIADLRPVCPNCHAMLHRQSPPLTIEQLQEILDEVRGHSARAE